MKISKIAAMCKKNKTICTVVDADGKQWIGDGHAAFRVDDLPQLSEQSIFKIFGITENQQDKYMCNQLDYSEERNLSSYDPFEEEVMENGYRMFLGGKKLIPLYTTEGAVWIDTQYFTPFDDENLKMDLYKRKGVNGTAHIVIKSANEIRALIMPMKVIDPMFIKEMDKIRAECARAMAIKEVRKENLEVDFATGEVIGGEDDESTGNQLQEE